MKLSKLALSFLTLVTTSLFAELPLNGVWVGSGIKEYQNIETGTVYAVSCQLNLVVMHDENNLGFPVMEHNCADGSSDVGHYNQFLTVKQGQLWFGNQSVGWINEAGFRFSVPMGEGESLSLLEVNAALNNGKMSFKYGLTPIPNGNPSRLRQTGDFSLEKN
jgi:hypothetical protein